MSQRRFQFSLAEVLSGLTVCALLIAFILYPEPPRSVLVVAAGVIAVWLAAGRWKAAELRTPTRAEKGRLILAILGLTVAAVALGALIIGMIIRYSNP